MALKLLAVYVLITMSALVRGLRRGPHHPRGQQPVDQKHHHYIPNADTPLTRQDEILQDVDHLEEHSETLTAQMLAKMTPEEKEFHYFMSHDFDQNTMLDGLELLKAVYHIIDEDTDASDITTRGNIFDVYVDMVDKTLLSDDTNRDGFISYTEYRTARSNRTVTSEVPIIFASTYTHE